MIVFTILASIGVMTCVSKALDAYDYLSHRQARRRAIAEWARASAKPATLENWYSQKVINLTERR